MNRTKRAGLRPMVFGTIVALGWVARSESATSVPPSPQSSEAVEKRGESPPAIIVPNTFGVMPAGHVTGDPGAWVVWETDTERLKLRQKLAVYGVQAGTPDHSCTHSAPLPKLKSREGTL